MFPSHFGRLLFVCVVVALLCVMGRNGYRHWLNHALAEAVMQNDADAVCSLLERGANSNYKDKAASQEAEPVLQMAVRNGSAGIARLLLNKGAVMRWAAENQTDTRKQTDTRQVSGHEKELMREAIESNSLATVKLLIERGAPSDLYWALCMKRWKIARFFFERGEMPAYTDAVKCAEAPLRQALLAGAKGDINRPEGSQFALNIAAELGYADAARFLLDKGAKVDVVDAFRQTALLHAAQEGHTAIVQMLLAKGANAAYKNHAGATALRLAQKYHHADIIPLLKKAGAKE